MLHDWWNDDILLLFSRPVVADSRSMNCSRRLPWPSPSRVARVHDHCMVMLSSPSHPLTPLLLYSIFPQHQGLFNECISEEALFLKSNIFLQQGSGERIPHRPRDSRSRIEWFLQMEMWLCKRILKNVTSPNWKPSGHVTYYSKLISFGLVTKSP